MKPYFNYNSNYNPNSNPNYNKKEIDNYNKKERFINNQNRDLVNIGEINRLNVIEIESKLKATNLNNKSKTDIKLADNLNPENYNLPIINNKNLSLKNTNVLDRYEEISAFQPWKRQVDINKGTDIRFGNNTRLETKNIKLQNESNINERWDFIDNRFQKLDHIVMPQIRGGESTRKDHQQSLIINRNNIDELGTKELKFDFKY
jgi:hypothetical protein